MRILAVDPGKHCGIALIEYGGTVNENGVIEHDKFTTFLEELDCSEIVAVVVEDYIVYKSKTAAHAGSKVETVQVIGMLDMFCKFRGIRLFKQQPWMYKEGAKYMGAKLPKGHVQDQLSALYHGLYFLKSIGQYKTALERRMENG